MSQPYIYDPLPTTYSIRVLSLLPSRDQKAPLQCKLLQVSLRSKPRFEALSYCWGSPVRDRLISCDGRQIFITENCEAALYVLRHSIKSRMLWIDSMCINQQSLLEKNHQVKLMMEVYSSAKCVLIWLGPGSSNTDLAFDHLSKTAIDIKRSRLIPFGKGYERASKSAAKRIRQENDRHFNNPKSDQSIIRYVHESAWFTRMWTIQEVAVARKAKIICGNRQLSWDSFVEAHLPLIDDVTANGTYPDVIFDMSWYSHVEVYIHLRRIMRQTSATKSFLTNQLAQDLKTIFEKKATDPKDKALALYGLFRAIGIILPDPDYSKSTGVIYREMARAIMVYCNNLDLFLFASGVQTTPDLPSWTPNWTRKRHSLQRNPLDKYWFDFQASRSPIDSFRFSEDSSQLIARGVLLDSITHCEDPFVEHSSSRLSIDDIYMSVCTLRRWLSLLKRSMPSDAYVDGTRSLDAFISTALPTNIQGKTKEIPDLTFDRSVIPNWVEILMGTATCCGDINSRNHLEEKYNDWKKQWAEPSIAESTLDRISQSPEFATMLHLREHKEVWAVHRALVAVASTFRFFITQDGYIGKGEIEIEVGDAVAAFPGFRYSVFLRPMQGAYLFVGLGMIQHREGLAHWLSDDSKLVDITIL